MVNAANSTLLDGGGVDGAIHDAGGQPFWNNARRFGVCDIRTVSRPVRPS
ncbi:MAG: macro domain-containing protein [Nitrospiraceae bacterium]